MGVVDCLAVLGSLRGAWAGLNGADHGSSKVRFVYSTYIPGVTRAPYV